jgi:hypothetical protein
MDAGGGGRPAEPTPRTFWTQLVFSGLILNFKNTFRKNSQLLFRTQIFILLLKNDIIPLHIYYAYTIL